MSELTKMRREMAITMRGKIEEPVGREHAPTESFVVGIERRSCWTRRRRRSVVVVVVEAKWEISLNAQERNHKQVYCDSLESEVRACVYFVCVRVN